ncbi:gluconolaconase [Mesorhizobium sp. CGMCC 1.15528]|uniref:Gluconolaconase n=1 Tax=Mesorhizobium zhangyense TaxID=1776730 RepID=A0A7C9R9K7_9HYPH|nr:gluconolaconase [Mesorhizobium zhangyense]NGN43554.1 gluconolaconase [Mesorhizobium zhangyense]
MIRRNLLASVALAILALATPAFAQDIAFSSDQSYPESFTYSAKQDIFMLGSVTQGLVARLDRAGKYSPFISDDRLVSTIGLLVDDASNTLWVTNSDPGAGMRTTAATQGKLADVATYDATTGAPKAYYDLGSLSQGAHFANDIALDAAGNAYITDSFAPLIYKIDTEGKASIFAQSPLFMSGDGFNLNGIAWHADGYLLVGKYNSGELFRISTTDPTDIRPVNLPEALVGADGIRLIDGDHLLVVQNLAANRTVELTSTDGWQSATITRAVASKLSMPTAAVAAGDGTYILNARLDTLFDPKAAKVGDYLLQEF